MPELDKVIVLSGHGAWNTKAGNKAPYTNLPTKCSMHFYTQNIRLLKSEEGRELEKGRFGDYEPSQTAGPFMSVPNMVLTWPRGLWVADPPNEWVQVKHRVGTKLDAVDEKKLADSGRIQFQIKKPGNPLGNLLLDPLGHLYLDDLFKVLVPAIVPAKSVLFVWSACRQVTLDDASERLAVKSRFTDDEELIKSFVDNSLKPLATEARLPTGFLYGFTWRLKLLRGRFMTTENVMEELAKYADFQTLILLQDDPDEALADLRNDIKDLFMSIDTTADPRNVKRRMPLNVHGTSPLNKASPVVRKVRTA